MIFTGMVTLGVNKVKIAGIMKDNIMKKSLTSKIEFYKRLQTINIIEFITNNKIHIVLQIKY